jgi:hypothetical protein
MDPTVVKAKLVTVLQNIQALSGETCPAISDTTRPVEALPNFTSKVWPVAAGMLGIALGKPLPCEINIFVHEQSKTPLSLNQTVALVIRLIEEQEAEEVVA